MKKSEQTKAKLIEAVINLLNKGKKISVASIQQKQKQLTVPFTDTLIISMRFMPLQ